MGLSNKQLADKFALRINHPDYRPRSVKAGNMSYTRDTAYSYGTPVAKLTDTYMLIAVGDFSMTTNKHISLLTGSVMYNRGADFPRYRVPDVHSLSNKTNLQYALDEIAEYVEAIDTVPKKGRTPTYFIRAARAYEALDAYARPLLTAVVAGYDDDAFALLPMAVHDQLEAAFKDNTNTIAVAGYIAMHRSR